MAAKRFCWLGGLVTAAVLLLAACAVLPATAEITAHSASTETGGSAPTNLPPGAEAPIAARPTPTPRLPATDQIVFTIPNENPFSGREGDPRPDWLGWGAETFAVGPDGSFWIADTAASPERLLHLSPEGKLLQQISLEGIALGVYDLAVSSDCV